MAKDAWEILMGNSTLADGDAWEHLNNQDGTGTGGGGFIYSKEPIQVSESEILQVAEREALVVSARVLLNTETERILLTNEQSEIIKVE